MLAYRISKAYYLVYYGCLLSYVFDVLVVVFGVNLYVDVYVDVNDDVDVGFGFGGGADVDVHVHVHSLANVSRV